jgi:hypothetical protein
MSNSNPFGISINLLKFQNNVFQLDNKITTCYLNIEKSQTKAKEETT